MFDKSGGEKNTHSVL